MTTGIGALTAVYKLVNNNKVVHAGEARSLIVCHKDKIHAWALAVRARLKVRAHVHVAAIYHVNQDGVPCASAIGFVIGGLKVAGLFCEAQGGQDIVHVVYHIERVCGTCLERFRGRCLLAVTEVEGIALSRNLGRLALDKHTRVVALQDQVALALSSPAARCLNGLSGKATRSLGRIFARGRNHIVSRSIGGAVIRVYDGEDLLRIVGVDASLQPAFLGDDFYTPRQFRNAICLDVLQARPQSASAVSRGRDTISLGAFETLNVSPGNFDRNLKFLRDMLRGLKAADKITLRQRIVLRCQVSDETISVRNDGAVWSQL